MPEEHDPVVLTLVGSETDAPTRKCGRCRGSFPADGSLHPTAQPEWWICAECRSVLLGRGRSNHPSAP